MFVGTHPLSLDDKGRVILPVKFRDALKDGAYVTKSLDGCLGIYRAEDFEAYADELKEKVRRGSVERTAVRTLMAGAAEVIPDRQGRITIPAHLRTFAGLEREVVVTGALSRIEIWDAERWRAIDSEAERTLTSARPGLDDIGI